MRNIKNILMLRPNIFVHGAYVLAAYILGFVAVGLVGLPFFATGAFVLLIVGAVIALPLLMVTLAVLVFAKAHIEEHPKLWCSMAAVIVSLAWLAFEYTTNFSNRLSVLQFLSDKGVWQRDLLAFACASASATIYYTLLNCTLKKIKKSEV